MTLTECASFFLEDSHCSELHCLLLFFLLVFVLHFFFILKLPFFLHLAGQIPFKSKSSLTFLRIESNSCSQCHVKLLIFLLKTFILLTPARPLFSCSLQSLYLHTHLPVKTPAVTLNAVLSSAHTIHCGKKLTTKKVVIKLCASLVSSKLLIL